MSEVETMESSEPEPQERPTLHGVAADLTGERVVLHPAVDQWLDLAIALLADGYTMCLDLTAVDYLTYRGRRPMPDDVIPERFEVVVAFADVAGNRRLWAKVQIPESAPSVDSLVTVYPGADFLEREVFDMFGIDFTGHPDLSRILMPETWQGHPLRKDYAIGAIPVQFKGDPGPR